LIGPDFTTTDLAAGFHRRPIRQDMLLRNAEVQYVCRNAARQSYGRYFAVPAASTGFSRPMKCHREQSGLMFRRGWQFCNIEPKICQYG
jgi:hypothetical protein